MNIKIPRFLYVVATQMLQPSTLSVLLPRFAPQEQYFFLLLDHHVVSSDSRSNFRLRLKTLPRMTCRKAVRTVRRLSPGARCFQ